MGHPVPSELVLTQLPSSCSVPGRARDDLHRVRLPDDLPEEVRPLGRLAQHAHRGHLHPGMMVKKMDHRLLEQLSSTLQPERGITQHRNHIFDHLHPVGHPRHRVLPPPLPGRRGATKAAAKFELQ